MSNILSSTRDYKLVIRARRIPEGAVVTRINGVKRHRVKRKITIDGQTLAIAEDGAVFLASKDSGYSTVSGDVELLWHLNGFELAQFVLDEGYEA